MPETDQQQPIASQTPATMNTQMPYQASSTYNAKNKAGSAYNAAANAQVAQETIAANEKKYGAEWDAMAGQVEQLWNSDPNFKKALEKELSDTKGPTAADVVGQISSAWGMAAPFIGSDERLKEMLNDDEPSAGMKAPGVGDEDDVIEWEDD